MEGESPAYEVMESAALEAEVGVEVGASRRVSVSRPTYASKAAHPMALGVGNFLSKTIELVA